jgi:hypothetical protein
VDGFSEPLNRSIYSINRKEKEIVMSDQTTDRTRLERRRKELLDQLDRVNNDLKLELDRDPEEQAIQLEHDQVSVSMEDSLRRELAEIEARLEAGKSE